MTTNQLNCAACGIKIYVPDHLEFLNCPNCGSILAILRGEGYTAFKVVESITKSLPTLEDLNRKTSRLQKLDFQRHDQQRLDLQQLDQLAQAEPAAEPTEQQQISQEIQLAEMKLANMQAEIHSLEHAQETDHKAPQLRSLHVQEYQLLESLRLLYKSLAALGPQDIDNHIEALENEIYWINAEVRALDAVCGGNCFDSNTAWETATDKLREYRRKLQIKISDLQIQKIKDQLASFQVKEVDFRDKKAIEAVLTAIRADQERVARMRQTLEVSIIKDELAQRCESLIAKLDQLKKAAAPQPLMIPVSSHDPEKEKKNSNGFRARVTEAIKKLKNGT